MLNAFQCDHGRLIPLEGNISKAAWVDLLSATQAERDQVQQQTGLAIPSLASVSEIETSSRLSQRNGVLYLNMPLITAGGAGPTAAPAGFVLSRDRLITVRFAESSVFNAFIDSLKRDDAPFPTAAHIFTAILEAVVDRQADALEHVRDELDSISHLIFRMGTGPATGRKQEDALLRRTLGEIGRIGDLLSHIRDTQVGASRIIPYVEAMTHDWLPQDLHPRMASLRSDIASISEFNTHLSEKMQFLLDATLGFISIAQNNVMKVMAIASVVGIPPVLIAGIYGMNFKNMPELEWTYGYAYGWFLIILTTLIPLAIFRWRKWI